MNCTNTRRATSLLRAKIFLVLGMMLIAADPWVSAQTSSETTAAMRQARKKAAQRQRRIMYNDDGCHTRPFSTPDEFLSLRLKQLLGTQVDTICYCTGGGGLFWGHIPKAGELIGESVADTDAQYVKDICKSLHALEELGTDPLALAVKFGHDNDMEVFWSYRMNNIEDSFAAWSHARWKREHPEYLLGEPEDWEKYVYTDPRKWWAGLDFEHKEVRAHILSIFEDVCQRYDIDGVDMDFFRSPRFFKPTTDGLPVSAEQIAMMNDFMRRIRGATERIEIQRQRPLLITCRVPLSVERGLAIGLDIETWLDEDLVDMLTFGGDLAPMAMAPQLRTMAELAHRHGVRAYANIGGSGMQKGQGYVADEAWWAAAMNAWHAGVDGIYTFNLFPTKPDVRYSHLGSPENLKGLDKLYAIDPIEPKNLWGFNRSGLVIPDRLPIILGPSGRHTVLLPVGEDIVANAPKDKNTHALLRLRFAGLVDGDYVVVRLNGQPPLIAKPTAGLTTTATTSWHEVPLNPDLVKAGANRIAVELATKRPIDTSILIDRLELTVTYR
jgi:hypothetical protein